MENNEIVKGCSEYTYLGVVFDKTGTDDREIKKRVTQARKIIHCLNSIFWTKEIGKRRKFNILQHSDKIKFIIWS